MFFTDDPLSGETGCSVSAEQLRIDGLWERPLQIRPNWFVGCLKIGVWFALYIDDRHNLGFGFGRDKAMACSEAWKEYVLNLERLGLWAG